MFAPHNNAMMNPIEQSTSHVGQHQGEQDSRIITSGNMLQSQTMNMSSRIGGGAGQRENQNVLNSIKMQGAIFSYYLEQLPDNTYKVNLRKNNTTIKTPQNQLLFSEFYEFCPFKKGQIEIIYIPLEEFISKTKTQSIYNTILAQVISYEEHFLCTLKSIEDRQNLDCKWYYSADKDKEGNTRIVYKKELFAGYNLLRLKQMMNDFENEILFGKREELNQKWKINMQSLLEVVVSGLFNIAQRSTEQNCMRCSVDRDSIFSLIHYILSSPLLKKIIHIILYQNFSDSGNIMKVIKGIYFEFNEIDVNELPEECKYPELDAYLDYGLDQMIRIGKTEYYIHKFMLVVRINLCFIKNDLSIVKVNLQKNVQGEDLILREIPLLKNYIQIITNQYDFYEQIFSPEQIISFILNKLEIDNNLLSISKKLSKQFSQTITFNINYESLYFIFKTDLNNAKSTKDPIQKIEKYDKVWKGLDNLRVYLLDQFEKNLQQQLDKESYQDQFFMIFSNVIHSYETKQFIKKRLYSNYRSYPILNDKVEQKTQKLGDENQNDQENEEDYDEEDIDDEFTDQSTNTKIRKSQLIQCISQVRSSYNSEQLKNSFLIQVNINDFILHAKKGDLCFVGYYISTQNTSEYQYMMAKITEKTDRDFTFEGSLEYKNHHVVPQENIKFALMSFQNWPNPQIFSGQILKYAIIDSSMKIQLIKSKALIDICQFFMSEDSEKNQELLDQYYGYLYRGGDHISSQISLNSLIQLMPSNISFIFEAIQQDNQFDLLNLKKQQSSILRNQFDIYDSNSKQVVIKFDENYKFKRPLLNPDQFSFASTVDSNQHIQEQYNSLIENMKNLLTKSLLKDNQQNLQIEYSYDSELEALRDTHIEQIEQNIEFICYNITDTFNQYVQGFNISPELIKQIYLLSYHDQKTRDVFYNEQNIIQYLLVKLILKHVTHFGLQFKLLPSTYKQGDESNIEEFPLAFYDEYTKSFTVAIYLGEKLDNVIIPSTLDISYNLIKQLVNCELKYVVSAKYNKEENSLPNVYTINQDLKNYKLKIDNDLKKFTHLLKGEYEALLIFLITLSFQMRNLSLICSLQEKEYSQFIATFVDKQQSTYAIKSDRSNNSNVVEIELGYSSVNSVNSFLDITQLLNGQSQHSSIFKTTSSISIDFILNNNQHPFVINQYINSQYTNGELIDNHESYKIKMVDITNYTELTILSVESAVLENNTVSLKVKESIDQLKGKGTHYIYVVYYNNVATSYNYFLKNTDENIQNVFKQSQELNFKINQQAIIFIQANDPKNIKAQLFDNLNIQLSQGNDDNPISLSSYSQRYQEIITNKKMRLIKINMLKGSDISIFTFDLTSRYITADIIVLTINNSKAQILNIKNTHSAFIFTNQSQSKANSPHELRINYLSTSKILFEKTQLIGCMIDDQPLQIFKSKKDKQKKDNNARMSPIFQIFNTKTERKLMIPNEDLVFIEQESELKKYVDIQRQVFMEDGRQSVYSRAGQVRKDVICFYDGYANTMQPTESLDKYQVIFVHILFRQIIFKGSLKYSDDKKQLVCQWTPLIKGSYRMYINNCYIPNSEEIIGVIANQIDQNNIKIEKSDKAIISYYDILDCEIQYKDIYGNNYTEFEKTQAKDPSLFSVTCKSEKNNLEFSFTQGVIDKVGKQKVNLKFDSQPHANLSEANNSQISFLYNKKELFQFSITVQGMNFEKREKQFHEALMKFKKNSGGQTIKINRDRFAEELLLNFENFDLKNGLYIQFKDEKGIDAGGLKREFYELIGKMMKDSSYQFFQLASNQTTEKYFFHPNCLKMKQSVQYFKIFGKLIAHTILHNSLLGIEFCEPIYKLLTKQKIEFTDLKHVLDSQTFNNYNFLKGLDAESLEDMCQYFIVTEKGKVIDLIPNGSQIQVTLNNLDQYLQETAQYYLQNRFQQAITNFVEGFESVFPADLLLKFIHPNELSIFTCGLREIDGAFLQKLTTFHYGTSILQSYYYRYLSEATTSMLLNFLKFITGSSSIPYDYSNFKLQIDFDSRQNTNKLPLSHTCFRSIEVPHYKSYEQMKCKFDLAFTLGNEGFAFG